MDKVKRINYNIIAKNVGKLPILYVRFSNKHVYTQLYDGGKIVFEVSSINNKGAFNGEVKPYNVSGAITVGKLCAEKMKQSGYSKYVLNRGSKKYQGVLKALNESLVSVLGVENE